MTDLITRDAKHVWHPFAPLLGQADPLPVVKAEGVYLHLEDGRKILDAVSSWWVNIHGHGNKYLAEALYKQALEMEHIIFAGFTHEPAVRLAERLLPLLPGGLEKMFFSDNGSTSVEVGLKLAIQYWHNRGEKRPKILALEGAYHGDTFGSMSLAGKSAFFEAFNDYLFEVVSIPYPHEGKEQETLDAFEKEVKSGDVSAFIYEPLVQGSAGMRIYSPEVLEQMLALAKQYEVVRVADEVMTGFGRTGKLFASEYMETAPDIICLSKGITGGTMPLGVTCLAPRVVDAFRNEEKAKAFYHGHSYTANPLACSVANASLDILLGDGVKNMARIEESHQTAISRFENHPMIRSVKCLGTILSMEVETGSQSSYFSNIRDRLYQGFLDQDVLLRPLGNVVYLLPPYIISNEELERIYSLILEQLDLLQSELQNQG